MICSQEDENKAPCCKFLTATVAESKDSKSNAKVNVETIISRISPQEKSCYSENSSDHNNSTRK